MSEGGWCGRVEEGKVCVKFLACVLSETRRTRRTRKGFLGPSGCFWYVVCITDYAEDTEDAEGVYSSLYDFDQLQEAQSNRMCYKEKRTI